MVYTSPDSPWKYDRPRPYVLLKVVNPDYQLGAPAEDCLRIEEKVATSLPDHAGIMKCNGHMQHDGVLGLTYEDKMHETLQSAILRNDYTTTYSHETRKQWCLQVVEALVACHKNDVLHEDIHPENAVLARDGRSTKLQLANFGTAESERQGFFPGRVNNSGFFDPKTQEVNPAKDIFAVGSLMYTIMTGLLPGRMEPIMGLSEVMQYGKQIDDLLRKGEVPTMLPNVFAADVIVKCWKGGYQTAAEVLEDLEWL